MDNRAVKFVLTDIHPHIPDWTEAAKRSEHLSFVAEPVDAANAPRSLEGNKGEGKKIFRLYNLAFHHFEDKLGMDILRNTIETADGFGYVTECPIAISLNANLSSIESSNFKNGHSRL